MSRYIQNTRRRGRPPRPGPEARAKAGPGRRRLVFYIFLVYSIFPKQSLAVGILTVLVKGPWKVRRHVDGCGLAFLM